MPDVIPSPILPVLSPTLSICILPHGKDLGLPHYVTEHAAGIDLRAAIDHMEVISAGRWLLINTGISIAVPEGYEAQIRPRSGLALKHGVTVLNSPGTIDADYRGEVKVLLINHDDVAFYIERGDRIAQMVIAPVCQAKLAFVSGLSPTPRGDRGFGSSGVK
ncbi:MAG: dUTP diphosphatase [Mariprofundaceae bacterium]|nr:dUTP diphosphatase [Mariprofundaceae bacterium]